MKNHRSNTLFKRTGVATAISAALLISASGYAAEQSDTDEDKAEQDNVVMVTANRRTQAIHKVPFNISAISGDILEDAQITDAAELMRSVAGVAVVDRGHRNSGVINGIMIRGLNVDGSALGDYALSAVPTVSTYVNDTPIYANFILRDIDRVEILRGPQGTLYGSGSLGGTVKYIVNRPELGEFSGKVSAGLSSSEGSEGMSWSTDVILNVPLSETMAMRFVGGKLDYAGITDYVNVYNLDANRVPVAPDGPLALTASYRSVEDADTVDISHARLSFLFEPSDTFSALFTYQTQSDDIGGRRQQTVGQDGWGDTYNEYENGSVMLEPSDREIDLASLEMDFDLGFATLTSSTSSYEQSGSSISENTGFYAQNNWLAAFYYNYPRPMAEASRTYSDKAFIQELRLVSESRDDYDYVVGLYYQDQDLGATQESYLRGFQNYIDNLWGPGIVVSDRDFLFIREQNFKETAVFGEVTAHLSEALDITVGTRFFNNTTTNLTDMGVGLWAGFSPTDSSFYENEDTGNLLKMNIAYAVNDDQTIYATLSEGYRRGGTNAVPLVGIFAESEEWLAFEPDTDTNYEIGFKGRTDSINYNFSAFYVDWQNIQINTATTNWGFFAAQNGGAASTAGIEIEVDGYFGENKEWHYGVGYAYVDGTLDEDMYAPSDLNEITPIALAGTKLPGTPENTISASLTNTQNLDNGWYWINRLGYYYQSDTENAISTSPRFAQTLDGFSILDFSSSISADEWSVTLWIKNLTNEIGTTGVFKEEYMGTSPAQNYFGNGSKQFMALPRTIGLTATYEF
jgi:iron complex outermembrane recepter protein